MKITILTPVFPPYVGGMGNVAYYHAKILSRRGYDVRVCAPNYKNRKNISEPLDGFEVMRIAPWFSYGNAAYIAGVNRHLTGCDVIFLHYPFFGGVKTVLRWKRHHPSMKLVTYYHMDVFGRGLKKFFFSLYTKFFLQKILAWSDAICVNSEDYALHSKLRRYYLQNTEKFFVVPHGVDTKTFTPGEKSTELFKKYKIQGQKIVLFVGGLDSAHYFKGVDILLQAFTRVSVPSVLIIVGKGNMLPKYKIMAERLGIQNRVIFVSDYRGKDLPELYRFSDVFALPSIDSSEAFGLVLLEAMSSGKPVIASDLAGVRTAVKGSVTGVLVKPGDVDDLADALSVVLKNEALSQHMGQEGRTRMLKYYDWEKIGDTLEHVLRTV